MSNTTKQALRDVATILANAGWRQAVTPGWGQLSSRVTNLVDQIPAPKSRGGPDLRAVLTELLSDLREAAENGELSPDDAQDAVAELEVIATSAAAAGEPKMLEQANKAVRGLGRIVDGVAALGTKVTELKDAVTSWFTS